MVEGARLESVFRLIPNEGSNPSLSATFHPQFLSRPVFTAESGEL